MPDTLGLLKDLITAQLLLLLSYCSSATVGLLLSLLLKKKHPPAMTASLPPFLDKPEQLKELFDSVDTFLFDCDGVIYHGPEVVPGVKTVLQMIRDAGE